ncbi:MAG: hypothetical protein PHS45_05360 [Bacilli bacterium]|nr:hypothetical protein [Bacilli bacterium]
MKRITKGELITLDNNKEYVVVDIVEQGDKRYLYLVNQAIMEVVVVEEIVENDEIIIETLDSIDKVTEIVKIVVERLKNN